MALDTPSNDADYDGVLLLRKQARLIISSGIDLGEQEIESLPFKDGLCLLVVNESNVPYLLLSVGSELTSNKTKWNLVATAQGLGIETPLEHTHKELLDLCVGNSKTAIELQNKLMSFSV